MPLAGERNSLSRLLSDIGGVASCRATTVAVDEGNTRSSHVQLRVEHISDDVSPRKQNKSLAGALLTRQHEPIREELVQILSQAPDKAIRLLEHQLWKCEKRNQREAQRRLATFWRISWVFLILQSTLRVPNSQQEPQQGQMQEEQAIAQATAHSINHCSGLAREKFNASRTRYQPAALYCRALHQQHTTRFGSDVRQNQGTTKIFKASNGGLESCHCSFTRRVHLVRRQHCEEEFKISHHNYKYAP